MLGRLPASAGVVDQNRVEALAARQIAVDEHQRHVGVPEVQRGPVLFRGGREDEAVHPAHHVGEHVVLPLAALVAVGEQDAVRLRPGDGLHPLDDLGEVGVGDVRDDDSDGMGAPGFQGLRRGTRPVAQLIHGRLDGLGRAHPPATQETRDGRGGYTGVCRHVMDGDQVRSW